jgi:LytS/YehU family sensor histidine kinase
VLLQVQLSEVLRYQLYDCNREVVLLNAEIQFIANYLQIEKLYDGNMDFKMKAEGG